MARSRYANRFVFTNNDKQFQKEFFDERDVKQIDQYESAVLYYPTTQAMERLAEISLVWGATDRLDKIANEYYKDPQYWWIIAWYNMRPTDAHFSPGDVYSVPLPLDVALQMFDRG